MTSRRPLLQPFVRRPAEPFQLDVSHYDLKCWPPGLDLQRWSPDQLTVPELSSRLVLTLLGCCHLKLLESRSKFVPVTSS